MSGVSTSGGKRKFSAEPYLLLIPIFALLLLFCFYPFVKTLVSTFCATDEVGRIHGWIGTAQWKLIFGDYRTSIFIGNTLQVGALNLLLSFTSSMILALIGSRRGKGQRLVTTLFALPLAISGSCASIIWGMMYKTRDLGGILASLFRTDWDFLGSESTALLCVMIATAWTHLAGGYIYLLAGFRNVPDELLEAATLDGANGFVKATRVMIPLASPQIFYVLFLSIVGGLKTFTQIRLLTAGGPNMSTVTLTFEIWAKTMNQGMYGGACCLSIILFVIIMAVTGVQFAFEKKLVFYR